MPDSRTLWTAVVIICIAVSVFFSVKKTHYVLKRLQQLMAANSGPSSIVCSTANSPACCTRATTATTCV